MLDSLVVKQTRGKPGFLIFFKDKLATIHDSLGAGVSKIVRRLLPDTKKGETFKASIIKVIIKVVQVAAKK